MENMKSLADQIREQLVKPTGKKEKSEKEKLVKKTRQKEVESTILAAILNYDNTGHKSMVHVRFDEKTVRTMNQFKMATNVDLTRLVSFAVQHLFDTCPELKLTIKQFIQNTEL